MKSYEEALARVQELIDEKHSNVIELEKLDNLLFDAELDSGEEERLQKEIDYLRWRNQELGGTIRGAISMLRFVYEDDSHDIYNDIELHFRKDYSE